MDNKIKGYTLSPLTTRSMGGFATACMMDDFITGKNISSSGGGAYAISAETFELLKNDQEVRDLIKRKLAD